MKDEGIHAESRVLVGMPAIRVPEAMVMESSTEVDDVVNDVVGGAIPIDLPEIGSLLGGRLPVRSERFDLFMNSIAKPVAGFERLANLVVFGVPGAVHRLQAKIEVVDGVNKPFLLEILATLAKKIERYFVR